MGSRKGLADMRNSSIKVAVANSLGPIGVDRQTGSCGLNLALTDFLLGGRNGQAGHRKLHCKASSDKVLWAAGIDWQIWEIAA